MEPPSFSTSGPQIVRAAPGGDASLVLPLPSGSQPFQFEWSREGVKLEDRFKPSSDSSGVRLTISSASTDDSGVYTLQASNAAGKDTTRVRLEISPDEKPTGEDPPSFLRRLQDLTVKVGTRTRFLVEIVSSTECRVTWYRNERRLLEAERIALVRDGNFWCADISAVSVDDAGRWTCTAENVGGRASCSAHLNVLVPKAYKRPEFVEELRALLTEQGTVSLECKVVGVPTPVLRWFKDSREIKAGDVFALTANAEDPTSLGTYTCEAVNCMGRAYSSSKVHVIGRASREGSARPSSGGAALESSPIFTKELEDQFVRICEPLTLSCNIVVPPWPRSVVWYNKEGKIEPSEKYRLIEDGLGGYLLEIQQAEWPDEGEWKCVATSSGGRVGITTCYVSMDVPKNYRKPRFMENLQAVLTEEGLVSFECKVVGFPTPLLSWFKDGQELKPGDVYQLTGSNSLGSYCCIARNCMGQGSSSAELTVEDIQNQLNEEEKLQLFSKNQAPKFLQGLKSVEAKIDEPFRFTIKVAIPPDPTVLWYRDDQPVDESSRCRHGKEERGVFFLDIQSLEFMDQAEWKCIAMNDFGHSITSCFLKLIIPRHYKKPRFLENLQAILSEEGAVNLECKVIGVPQPILKWYKDGEELKPGDIHRIISGQDGTCCLGTYTCEAQNCMGIAASSASLLGFEDSIKEKCKKKCDEQTIQRNLSLSTIHEERTSQMYDTPVGDLTLDDKGEISFSFDGKEVSVSLYETPDLTEEEALQIVEMYADQLSENVTEHNVVELPPLRFVKETSTSGNLLMEAIIIDVSPEYFTSPEEDLRTEADVEDISIADENGPQQLPLDHEDVDDYLEKKLALLSDEKDDLPIKLDRKKSDSQKSVEDYFSLSQDQSLSEEKKDDDTQFQCESDLQSFASARSSGKPKSKSSKPSIEDGQESSDITKTVLLKEDVQNRQPDLDLLLTKNKKVRCSSQNSRRSSSSSERSINIIKEEVLEDKFESALKMTTSNESINIDIIDISSSLAKVINDVQMIERDIILQSELMSTAAMASRSLEVINSLIKSLSEILSITGAITESVSEPLRVTTSLFNRLPQSLNMLHQSLKIIGKCSDLESDNQTLVKKTCIQIIDKCGEELKKLNKQIDTLINKNCPFFEEINISDIKTNTSEIHSTITYFLDAIKDSRIFTDEIDKKIDKISPEIMHVQKTQKAVYELKNPLKSLLCIADEVNVSSLKGVENKIKSQIILNDMSAPIQDLQNALEQIESLSITETQSNLQNYNTEIIETVMDSVLKLRTSFEQLSAEPGEMGNEVVLNDVLINIRRNINEISAHLDIFEINIGTFDILNSDNKLEALQKMAQILINLENNLIILDVIPSTKIQMVEFHKTLTKILEYVIESNDAHKYFLFLEMCDTINRLNTLLKNMDSHDMLLALAGISNNLKIIQANIKKDGFTPDLNFTISSIISDLLLSIHETTCHAEISTTIMVSENIEDISMKYLEKHKLNFVIEQIETAVLTLSNVIPVEMAKDLVLQQSFDKIFPSLEEIKCNIASLNVNITEQEENISSMSDLSLTLTVANPLYDLNQSISVLNQVIYEKVKQCSENNSLKTELVIPLLDLRNALEVLQQDVISQYSENITYLNINSSIADAIQNIQSCILLVQGEDLLEMVGEISTLEDISAIKTTADIMDTDDFASQIVEETSIKTLHYKNTQYTSSKFLGILNNSLMNISKSIDSLDSSSIEYYCSTIKTVTKELNRAHNIIEGILNPIRFDEYENLPNWIKSTQLAMLIDPLQELCKSLSLIDIRNIVMENQSHIDEKDKFLQNISNCEINLNNSLNVINVAIETVDTISEIATKVDMLRKLCTELYIFLSTTKKDAEYEFLGLNVLEDAVSQMLNIINHSKNVDISLVKIKIENLHQCIVTRRDEIIGFTVKTPGLLDSETKILGLIDNIETMIVALSQLYFVSKFKACIPQATQLKLDVLVHLENITEMTAAFIQNLPEHMLHDNFIFTENLIKKFLNEVILLGCLLKQPTTPKRIIKILQVYYDLRQNFKQLQIHTQDLRISEDFNKWMSESEVFLKHIQTLLLENIDLISELIINIPISSIENNQIFLNKILESNHFTNLHNLAKLFLNIIESFKPLVKNKYDNIAKEIKFSNIDLEKDCETVHTYNLLSNCVSETISNKDIKDKQYLKIIFKIIQNYDECTNALGSGKKIIFIKCISECLEVLRDNFITESKDKAIGEKSISKEYNLKDMLKDITEPIDSLNKKLTNICYSNEQTGHLSKKIESLVESQIIADITKKINEHMKCENTYLDNFTISLLKDLNTKINSIRESLKYLVDLQDCCNIIFINEPIKELQRILMSILSEVLIHEEHKQLNEKTDSFLEHLDYYIKIIETVKEDSAVIKLDELKQSADIVKELRASIYFTEPFSDVNLEDTEINSEKIQLLTNLHKALTLLQVQVFDREQEFKIESGVNDHTREEMIKAITNLQDDLKTLTSSFFSLKSQELVIDNLDNREHSIQNSQISTQYENDASNLKIANAKSFQNVQNAINYFTESQNEEQSEISDDVLNQYNFAEMLQVDKSEIVDIAVSKSEISAENQPTENDLENLDFPHLKLDTDEIYTRVKDDLEKKQSTESESNMTLIVDETKIQQTMNESLNSEEISESKLTRLPSINKNIEDKNSEVIEPVTALDNGEELNNFKKQNESVKQNNCLFEEIKILEPCSRIEDSVNESFPKEDFITHEQHSFAIRDLEILLQELNDTINLSLNYPVIQKSEILQNTLDEVQTVIINLKCDFDGSINDIVEDLECNVSSVQLQINEKSSPALLMEACANLQILVTSLSNINNTKNVSPIATTKNAIYKCKEDVEKAIELLEKVPCLNSNNQLDKILNDLSDLKNTMKILKYNFSVDAEFLIIEGIEVLQNLNHVEDKVFSLENDLDASNDIDIISKDSIITAVHSIYGSICNMRSTLCKIQKIYMHENYGKPSAYFLKSIKNTHVLSTNDLKREWQKLGNSLRKVLNHFEDIKFYIHFDKTARTPSDSAFTKIILGELKIALSEVVLHSNVNFSDQVKDIINCVDRNLEKIENRTSLEVKEKIPIFKELSVKLFDLTENIKTFIKKDSSDIKNLLTDTMELSIIKKDKQLPMEKDDNKKMEPDKTIINSVLEYQNIQEEQNLEEIIEKDALGIGEVKIVEEKKDNKIVNLIEMFFKDKNDYKENSLNNSDNYKNLPEVGGFEIISNDSDKTKQNYSDYHDNEISGNEKETDIIKKGDENKNFMIAETLVSNSYIYKTELENLKDENNISKEKIVTNCESKIHAESERQNYEQNRKYSITVNDDTELVNSDDILKHQSVQKEKHFIQRPKEIINKIIYEETSPLQLDISINDAAAKVLNVEKLELTKDVSICSTKIYLDISPNENIKKIEKIILEPETDDVQFQDPVQNTNQTYFDQNENVEKIILVNEKNKQELYEEFDKQSGLDEMDVKKGDVLENESVLETQNKIKPKNEKDDYNITEIAINNCKRLQLYENEHITSEFCEQNKDYNQSNMLEVEIKEAEDRENSVEPYDEFNNDKQIKKGEVSHNNQTVDHIKDDYENKEINNMTLNVVVNKFANAIKKPEVTEFSQQCDMMQKTNFIEEIQMLEQTEKIKALNEGHTELEIKLDGKYLIGKDTILTDFVSSDENEKRFENNLKEKTSVTVQDAIKEEKVDTIETIEKVCQAQNLFASQDDDNEKLHEVKGRKLESNKAHEFIDKQEKITEVIIVSNTDENSNNSMDGVQDTSQGKYNQNVPYTKTISLEDHDNNNGLSDEKYKCEIIDEDNFKRLTETNKNEKKNSVTQNKIFFFTGNENKIHEQEQMTEYLYIEEICDENIISSSEIALVEDEVVAIQNILYDKFDVAIDMQQIYQDIIDEEPNRESDKTVKEAVKEKLLESQENHNRENKSELEKEDPQKNKLAHNNNEKSNQKTETLICLQVTNETNNFQCINEAVQMTEKDEILQANTEKQNNKLDIESAVLQKNIQTNKKSEENTQMLICPSEGTEGVKNIVYDKALIQASAEENLPKTENHNQTNEMKKAIHKEVNRGDVNKKKLVEKVDELVRQVDNIENINTLAYKKKEIPSNQQGEEISLLSEKENRKLKNENNLIMKQNQKIAIEKDKEIKTEICQNINIKDQVLQESIIEKQNDTIEMNISLIKEINQNITNKIELEDTKQKIERIGISELDEALVEAMVQNKLKSINENQNENIKTDNVIMEDESQVNNYKKVSWENITERDAVICQDKDIDKIENLKHENISILMDVQNEIHDSVQEKQKIKSETVVNDEIYQSNINKKKFIDNIEKYNSEDNEIPKIVCSKYEKVTVPMTFQDEASLPIAEISNAHIALKMSVHNNQSQNITNQNMLEEKGERWVCQNKDIEIITNQTAILDENLQHSIENMNSKMQRNISNEFYQDFPNERKPKGEQEKVICKDIHIKNENKKNTNIDESKKGQIEFGNAVSVIDNQKLIGRKESIDRTGIQNSPNAEKVDSLEYGNRSMQASLQDKTIEIQKENTDDAVENDKQEFKNIEQLEDKQNILTCQEEIERSIIDKKQGESNSKDETQFKSDMQYDEEMNHNIVQQRNNKEIDSTTDRPLAVKTKKKQVSKRNSKGKKEINKPKGSEKIDSQMIEENKKVQIDEETIEKIASVEYNEQLKKKDSDPVVNINLVDNLQDDSLVYIDRNNEQREVKIYQSSLKSPEEILQSGIENDIYVKCSTETRERNETVVEKQKETQSLLQADQRKEEISDQSNQLNGEILENKDIKGSQVHNAACMYNIHEEEFLKFDESLCNIPLSENETKQSELQYINKRSPTEVQQAPMLTQFESGEINSGDIMKIPRKVETIAIESNGIKNLVKDRPSFVNRYDANSNLEFLRPSGYNDRSFGFEDSLPKTSTHNNNKSNVIYKAQSLLRESQIKSIAPYCEYQQSFITESGTESKQRSTKASSESRISTVSERRAGLHRDVKKKPMFSTHLTDRTAVESSRVKLTCSILSSNVPDISWYKNGILLDNKQKCKMKYVDGLITLEILNAVPSDSGDYSCTVENENGSITSSATLKVYPCFEASPIPPTFTRSIRDIYHLHENELVLECRIRGQPLPTITWLKDNKPITQDERYQAHYLADGVCRLTIASPNEDDSGKYTCKAENSMWSDQITHDVHFIRKENLHIKNTISENRHELRRLHFSNVLSDHKVVSGGTIGLQVQISGSPTRVEWLREGRSIIETYRNAQTYIDRGLYTLALPDVTEKESGLYTCRAWNTHGTVDMNASITVVHSNQFEGKPATIISRPVKDLLITVGEDLNVSFRVQGEPKPKVFFLKGIKDITSSQRVCKMTSDDYVKFTLKRSVVSDAGTYCVLVKNVYGCDRAFVTVVIRQRASSDNLISDWIYPVDDLAIAVVDRNYKSVPDRIPNEPSAVDGGNNWVSLAWSKPDYQSKAPILAYKVESWLLGTKGGARWIELGVTPRNSFDAFNLKQGQEYHFRVTPRNRYGWGESVQTSTPIGIGLAGDRPEFIKILPGQLKVLVGEPAILSCSFKGKPIPEIIWMKNGHEIEEELGRVKVELIGDNTSLQINEIKMDDEGRYSCEATNVHGRSSTYSRMAVITDRQIWAADAKLKRERSSGANGDYPPQFTMRLRDRRVQVTYPVRLTCQVIGNPPPTVTWFKNAEEVSADSRHTTSQDEYFYTVEIAPTTLEDAGVYEAMARNGSGAISCRCNLVVDKGIRAYIAPEFCCGFEPLYCVCEGDELRISAVVEAYPTVGVAWYRDGVRLRPSRRAIMTLDHDGQIELALASVTARDAGVYTCTASNEVGRASTSGKVEIIKGEHAAETLKVPPIVISPDIPYSKEPMFIRKPRSSEAREGDTVIIECEVIGDPKPDVYWLRDFLKPDYYRDASHFKRIGAGPEYRFEIPHAKLDYTGAYSIVAKNAHGEAKAIISLQILAKDPSSNIETHNIRYGRVEIIPRFDKELTDLLCYDGDAIEFECTVSGNPEPDIRWYHYNEIIPQCSDFETSYNVGTARLRIKQVTVEDEGTYICEASNNMGKATSSACLVIYPPGEPNTLSQRLRRPPALLSASSTPRSTPRTTPARSLSRTPGPELSRLCSPSHEIAPKFYTYPYNRVVEEGDTVVFQCAVRGLPAPWTTWDKDGIIITPTARINIKEKDEMFRILEIEEVTIEDVGLYRIILENDYGRAEATARLEVISQTGKFYGTRSYSVSPRKCLPYRRRTPSLTRQD